VEDLRSSWLDLEEECEEGPTYHVNIVIEEEEGQGNTSLENIIGSDCDESGKEDGDNNDIQTPPGEKQLLERERGGVFTPVRKRKACEEEVERGRRTNRRRVKRQKLSEGSDEEWETRRKMPRLEASFAAKAAGMGKKPFPGYFRQQKSKSLMTRAHQWTNYWREA
jgi:hypothetical protein